MAWTAQNAAVTPSERARQRMREHLRRRNISQRILAERLERLTGDTWSQSRVHKVLVGRVELRVDDVAYIASVADTSLVDIMREPGREFVADLTPTELRVIEAIRARPEMILPLLQLLEPTTRGANGGRLPVGGTPTRYQSR